MNREVILRKGKLHDLDKVLILFEETIDSCCKNDYNLQQIKAWQLSAKNIDRWKTALENQFFIVAEINKKIVGFGSLKNEDYLDFLYTDKDFLRKGVANRIFNRLESISKKTGFKKLKADVSKTALPFFESKGFKIVKENKNIISEVEIINYKMIKLY